MSMAASKGNDIAVAFCAFINNTGGIFEEYLPVPLDQMSDQSLNYLILLLDKFGTQQKSKSIKKLLQKSRTEVESLAEEGNVYMQYLMGYWYSFDDSDTKGELACLKERLYWYEKAAKQDFYLAIKYVASFFDNTPGFETDYKKAAYWYRKGALNNLALPAYNLALMYNSGEGVQQNKKVASMWVSHAYVNENEKVLKDRILDSAASLGIIVDEYYDLNLDPELDINSAELNDIY
jgi:TPR repeat protein